MPFSRQKVLLRIREVSEYLRFPQQPSLGNRLPLLCLRTLGLVQMLSSGLYLERHPKVFKKPRSAIEDARMLKVYLYPTWGHRRMTDIKRKEVVALLDAIAKKRKAPIMANRVRALIHKVFNFALSRDLVPFNPAAGVPHPAKDRAKTKTLSFHFAPHELRRTAGTGMGELGVHRDVISKVLNHKSADNTVTAVYDRYDRIPEMRKALERWGVRVEAIFNEGINQGVVMTDEERDPVFDFIPVSARMAWKGLIPIEGQSPFDPEYWPIELTRPHEWYQLLC